MHLPFSRVFAFIGLLLYLPFVIRKFIFTFFMLCIIFGRAFLISFCFYLLRVCLFFLFLLQATHALLCAQCHRLLKRMKHGCIGCSPKAGSAVLSILVQLHYCFYCLSNCRFVWLGLHLFVLPYSYIFLQRFCFCVFSNIFLTVTYFMLSCLILCFAFFRLVPLISTFSNYYQYLFSKCLTRLFVVAILIRFSLFAFIFLNKYRYICMYCFTSTKYTKKCIRAAFLLTIN